MKPKRSLLLAVALISASALAYEVLLMRLFSIIQWHHFAYMIISLALLGYGVSGVFLALNRDRLTRVFAEAIMANMLLFSVCAPLCFQLAQHIPFNPAEMLWAPVQFLYLCIDLSDFDAALLFCRQRHRLMLLSLQGTRVLDLCRRSVGRGRRQCRDYCAAVLAVPTKNINRAHAHGGRRNADSFKLRLP